MPNVLSPRDLVFRPDNMDETEAHTHYPKQHIKDKVHTKLNKILLITR